METGGPSRLVRNISPAPGFDPQTVQWVANSNRLKYSVDQINFREQFIHTLRINTNILHHSCSFLTGFAYVSKSDNQFYIKIITRLTSKLFWNYRAKISPHITLLQGNVTCSILWFVKMCNCQLSPVPIFLAHIA